MVQINILMGIFMGLINMVQSNCAISDTHHVAAEVGGIEEIIE